jgi:hypothetical protein
LQVVQVTELKEVPPASWSSRDKWRTVIYAVNESSGRKLTIRSPQRLRSKVEGYRMARLRRDAPCC